MQFKSIVVPPSVCAGRRGRAAHAAQDWEDDYDLPVQKDLGDGWDGYGELEEFETLASEPPAKEAPAEAATTAPAKLEEAPEEATPAAPKEEPRKQPRHIFIASQPGVGKTTLVHKLLEKLREEDGEGGVDVRGFYTEEVRDPANPKQRLGFDVVRVGCLEPDEQTRSVLAREGKAPPTVGKYSVDVAAFEAFALPALEPPKEEEFQLPENPRLFKLSDGTEKAVSLLYEPTDEEEGANSRIRLEFGEVLNVPPSSLRQGKRKFRQMRGADGRRSGGGGPQPVNQQTPLFYAAAYGNLTIVRFLLNLGYHVNWRDSWRETALFYGIKHSPMDVVNVLIEHGASVLVRSKRNNQTPRELLKAQSRRDAATLVGVAVDDKAEDKHVACIEELASAFKPSSLTLTALSQTTNMVTGYVYANFEKQELTIGQVKVDRGHQGKGLGILVFQEKPECIGDQREGTKMLH
ncbi:NTPCR [Symbiodinium necroappetens]|uniref:NTPCR protein n=1 Tax=Symbiodinium necroappetens TaxID=1628268 RepID=A0A812VH60_9DINO|nr:NTPCR [Symbiodinium necroappetens]